MVDAKAPTDRQISTFPAPFKPSCTPYLLKSDFSPVTKEFCLKERDSSPIFKVSKIIIIGDVCVGKTSIISRFCCKLFQSTYKSTIGVDFQVERFDILGVPHTLQIWDTAGQERFKSIAQAYYRSAHVVIIVFDLSCIRTLLNCKNWLAEALTVAGSFSPYIFLVGSKKDLVAKQAYLNTESLAVDLAVSIKAEFWAVSSKTGENIQDLFCRIAALTFDDVIVNYLEATHSNEIRIGSHLAALGTNNVQTKRKERCEGVLSCS